MTKRRRSTDRHRVVVVVLAMLALAALVIPAASYTTADLSRSGSITVTDDSDGLLGLDTAAAVCENSIDQRLVMVTNSFDHRLDVTITLGSTETATFTDGSTEALRTLEPSATTSVDVDVSGVSGDSMVFSVTGTGTGLSVTMADRTVAVEECGT